MIVRLVIAALLMTCVALALGACTVTITRTHKAGPNPCLKINCNPDPLHFRTRRIA